MYFGSVRFFKNLIFLAVCALIAVPTVFAVRLYRQNQELRAAELEQAALLAAESQAVQPDSVFEPDSAPLAEPAGDISVYSADPPSYQALYTDFYAPQPYGATVRVENTIYLTFDDGPSERTDEILDILAEKNVKATFFVIGQSNPENLERMRRIVAEGHTIGMHSYSHEYAQVYSSIESFLDEFYRNFIQIIDATGVTPTAFRCPGGSINGYNGGFYQEMLSEMMRRGFVPYDWNVSSEDAVGPREGVNNIVRHVVQGSAGKVRGFVLFHDSTAKTTTPRALGEVIDRLRDMGFEFAAITPDTLPVLYNYED